MKTVAEISCLEAWRQISEMIDGSLDPDMYQRMELHLRNCAHCKAIYNGALNTTQLIADDRIYDLPPGLLDRLFKQLSTEFCGNPRV